MKQLRTRKINQSRVSLFALLISLFFSEVSFAGNDGTLPLRLGNDGTLPLRMIGEALSLAANPQDSQRRVATEVTITRALRSAMRDSEAASLSCQQMSRDVSKHSASGRIRVAALAFDIKGICYNHVNQTMEVVAQRQSAGTLTEYSFVVSTLTQEQPRNLVGRLIVTGSSQEAGRYVIKIQSPAGSHVPLASQ